MENIKKRIVIVGGGITGLTLLHALKKRLGDKPGISIVLLEKFGRLGGTITTVSEDGCIFETGPNGFISNQPKTLELIDDVNLTEALVKANDSAKLRYICSNNELYALPKNPKDVWKFSFFSLSERALIAAEMFKKPNSTHDLESLYEFGMRRFGKKFTQYVIDPVISGIYGGDIKKLNYKLALPKIHAIEKEYGSVLKGLSKRKKDKEKVPKVRGDAKMMSFKYGMGQFIDTLAEFHQKNILLNQDVTSVHFVKHQFHIATQDNKYIADELYLCTPAHVTAQIAKDTDIILSESLNKINYVPMVVVGLLYDLSAFEKIPKGFGYLRPSVENKEILGVLFENNIFPMRCQDGKVLLRLMIGGAHHPDVLEKSSEELLNLAQSEIETVFKVTQKPKKSFFKMWPKAIPQYDLSYAQQLKNIEDRLISWKSLFIGGNYYRGVSFNECIEHAYRLADKSKVLSG